MRANMWSRILVVLSLFSLTTQASPPATPEPGTRVIVKLAESSGQLPDPETLVASITSVGGQHQIQVKHHLTPGQQELTLDLWGGTVPQDSIPQTLREAFPVLASADIQVSTLDPRDRPKSEGLEDGKVVKKVKIIKKQ
ncbi:hypothetical protein [Hyalangium versicolor]|uniref:hypothetical protein n=1 Tax=Hyalangium versicolor TaxID=2861190 RepID=UPI001CCA81C4|nr:hypothetical protein [Hyalangium versicolor]